MTQETWLTGHPYLLSAAEFHAQVERAAVGLPSALACLPSWQDYEGEYVAGVPLLQSCRSTIDLRPVATTLEALIGKLGSAALRDNLAQDIRDLRVELDQDPDFSQRAVAALLDPDAPASTHFGLLRYLGWTVMARYLSRVVDAFGQWREEERWLRRYCPTCGSLPAMAQLLGIDPGRVRFLCCGCCGTRWRYRRTGCPFCENEDEQRLASMVVEGEADLRIDYCGSCGGYIKTYNGSGSEPVLLADWTSFHLDVIARDQGLNRLAGSLYEM
ncbi:MAG TPA: formate dehydrogenase accessory protein FdhE [Candidatus Acidoferrum sp.]|jgi:FdhE protein|nr:formate dehydrogenase accessory protein FdhE [Candidatus Acidoferrum sp.]